MIRALRQRHLRWVAGIALATAVIVLLARASRPEPPLEERLPDFVEAIEP